MGELESDGFGVKPDVQRVQHRTGHRHAEMCLVHRGNILGHHGDRITRTYTALSQGRGQAPAAGVGLRPGAVPGTMNDGDPIRGGPPPPLAGGSVAIAAHSSRAFCRDRLCKGQLSWYWLLVKWPKRSPDNIGGLVPTPTVSRDMFDRCSLGRQHAIYSRWLALIHINDAGSVLRKLRRSY